MPAPIVDLYSALFPGEAKPPTPDTECVRIVHHPLDTLLPDYIELTSSIDEMAVQNELQHWGFPKTVCRRIHLDGDPMIYFAVVPDTMPEHRLLAVEPTLGLLYWLDLPTWERTEVHLLRAIGLAGHRRAAIDQVVDYGKLMICWFVDCSWKPTGKSSIDWHVASLPRQQCKPHERISSRITFTPGDGDAHCILRHPIPLSDIFSLFGTSDCLLTDVECLQLPAECKAAITSCTTATRPFDRIRIYTDGSSHPSQKHWHPELVMQEGLADSWAFTVIGEYYGSSGNEDQSSYVFLGYQTHPITYNVEAPYYVGADHVGSDISEREALFWAALWRLAYDSNVPTVFLTDSSTSAKFVSGDCGTTTAKPGMHHRLTRGIFQALEAALPGDSLQITHIPGHCGEVWNEFCDVAAKFSSTTTHWKPRQQVDMQKWRHLIPHLWMYFSAEVHGLPNFNHQGFVVTPPHLPPPEPTGQQDCSERPSSMWKKVQLSLSLVTANVRTLQGKLDYLRAQFADCGAVIIGLQETRSDPLFTQRDGYLRLSSGNAGGHHGVELWVATKIPYAYVGGRPQYFEKRHVVVIHAHPRCLITRLTTDWIDCICVVLHAPQSGRPYHECEEWWQSTTTKVQEFSDLAPVYVMLDANATTGPCDGCTIFDHDDDTSKHTELFREFLRVLNLYAPSTTDVHYGPDATWTSPDGSYSRRIDYVLVPQLQYSHCVFSGPLCEFDLGNGDTDHVATGVQLEWSTETHKPLRAQDHTIPCWSAVDDDKLHQELSKFQAESWTCDIETQVQHFNRHIHSALHCAARREHTQCPKKPYIDDDIWQLRNDKNSLKRRLRGIGARGAP